MSEAYRRVPYIPPRQAPVRQASSRTGLGGAETARPTMNRGALVIATAAATTVAGILHFVVAPEHAEHAPAHALVFLVLGVLQIAWTVAFLWRPNIWSVEAGILLNLGSILLWALTRFIPAPFTGEPEEIDVLGIATKIAELIAVVLLLAQVTRVPASASGFAARPGRLTAIVLVLALVGTGVAYGTGVALEPVFPGLKGAHHHDEAGAASEGGTTASGHEHHHAAAAVFAAE